MDKIYTTPCSEKGLMKYNFFRRLLKTGKTPTATETVIARQALRRAHNAFSKNLQACGGGYESDKMTAIPGILDEISRNINKIDQNLYSAKGSIEELLHVNNRIGHTAAQEIVSLN